MRSQATSPALFAVAPVIMTTVPRYLYSAFCSGAWALLVGLAIQHSVLGAGEPEPVARQSSVDMTVSQDETVMTVTGPTRPMRSSGM